MDQKQKEEIQEIIRFSKTYGLSSSTHSPQYQSDIDHSANSRCVRSKPPLCLLDRLPEEILHNILSRLPMPELLMAQKSCRAWYRIVSSCWIFQELYDEKNQQSWIALRYDFGHIHNGFVLFNTNNVNQYCFRSMPPIATSWHLQGVADGLMLIASIEGRLAVVNPLTGRFRQLPDTRIGSRLRLESCLKKIVGHPNDEKQPSISANIVVDSASTTFKVMVLGEVRERQVHALIYSSSTDTWTIKLCSEIDHKFFRRFFHSTVDGNNIYCAPIGPRTINNSLIYPRRMVSYNTETQLSVVDEMPLLDLSVVQDIRCQMVDTIGIVNYKSRIFLLGVITGYNPVPLLGHFCAVALWEANPSAGEWMVLTTTPPEWLSGYLINVWRWQLGVAYDGERSVTISARSESSRTILLALNLETKEWNLLCNHNIPPEISHSLTSLAPRSGNKGLKSFHIKLKLCTAI